MTINESLIEIFAMVLKVNEQGKHHIFLDIAPHVDWITVQIFEGQWFSEADPTFRVDCKYKVVEAEKNIIELKDEILKYMD